MANERYIELDSGIEAKIPLIPNFIILKNGQSIHVSDFNEKSLKKIADEWVFDFLKRAKK